VARLGRHARVVVSAEGSLPADLEELRYRGPLAAVHHLLAFARLYVGESATMGAESAVLGTPSVVVSTSRRSYLDELEQRYGLARTYSDRGRAQEQALDEAEALLLDPATRPVWQARRERMLAEQEDVAAFVAEAVAGRVPQ
jgi:predicted glycosyltransferase